MPDPNQKIGYQVPFGAVYFRKSNPPREDWQRDYGVAAEDGLNVFRHWFMWSAIERKPGEYDWEEYDRQLDLAAENGMKTIIAELTHTVPDWAYRKWSHARQLRMDGTPMPAIMGVSAATGGFAPNGGGGGALTFNCPEVKEAAGAFLTAMAKRYKGHPGLLGYDIWNECNYSPLVDHSDWTKAAYRVWLREKYGDLDTLMRTWYRYSYAEWDDVMPPMHIAPYAEGLDWLAFKRDDYYGQMEFRRDCVRNVDPDCLIAAHGIAGAITDMASSGCDDWLAASKVEVYGYTWIQARKGAQPWRNFFGGDLNRAASRGKPFWHAERQGGPLWMQPQVLGRDKEDGRVAEPEDIRLWALSSFAAGARGMMNLRYRPLLDGPLFGAFGSYRMDGARTPRSDIASRLAKWLNAPEQAPVVAAKPVRGDIGILVIPEAQAWDYLLSHEGGFQTYREAMWGAYRGFFDCNIQADWVHMDDIDAYNLIYAPYPISMTAETAARLAAWVKKGGRLISEACPGYFGDHGKVGVSQPHNGLDAVFGAREVEVEFMPDIGDRVRVALDGLDLPGGGFTQTYDASTGTLVGHLADGRGAVVDHRHGEGASRLVGSHVSVGYYTAPCEDGRAYFRSCLDWAGAEAQVRVTNPKVQARLHEGVDGRFLWIINPERSAQSGAWTVAGAAAAGAIHWGAETGRAEGTRFTVGPRDALIFALT